jgi:hypothetical protein
MVARYRWLRPTDILPSRPRAVAQLAAGNITASAGPNAPPLTRSACDVATNGSSWISRHVILSSFEQLLPGSTRDARMLALAYFGPRDLENGHAATQMHKRGAILF